MGWTFGYSLKTAAQAKKEIVNGFNKRVEVLKTASAGKEFYMLVKKGELKTIVMALIERCDGIYGYKIMGEEDGPFYFNCPMKLLDMSNNTHEGAVKWREEVKARYFNAIEIQTLVKEGDIVTSERYGDIEFMWWHNQKQFVGRNTEGRVFRYDLNGFKMEGRF